MKVLMLSTDENIFKKNSEVFTRIVEYGKLVEELHVVVKKQTSNPKPQKLENVFLYPTNDKLNFLYFFSAYRIAKKILVANGRWLITAQDPFEVGLLGYLLKRKFKIPLQIQIHTDFLSSYFINESLKNKIRVFIAKWIIPKADGVRVVSERIKKSLVAQLPDYPITKISVLPIFVDIEKIKDTPIRTDLRQKYPGHDFIILMASRITKEKNIGLAVRTMKEVVEEYPKTLLLIVGSGPEEKKLKAKSGELKANIVFEPAVSFETLISYYKTADLYLLTSNYEGYGRTLIEAAAAGTPIVTTNVGIACELEGARTIPVGYALKCRQEIINSMSNPPQRSRLPVLVNREQYFAWIKKSWEDCANRQKKHYCRLFYLR